MTKQTRQSFDGLLNFFKPTGITSAKALYRVRRLTGVRKSGHAGTLDPAAEGVLLICMGKGTKWVERLMELPKEYRATARLDITSRTLDSDGPTEAVVVSKIPSVEAVQQAASAQQGEIHQVPPAVSALKIGGQPAYKLARKGRTVDLQARRVMVYSLEVERYDWPELEFSVQCGRGTYIRAMIRDWGQALGTGGCLTGLKRVAVGPFTTTQATTFEDLEKGLFEQKRLTLDQLEERLRQERSV